jgi:hypothetical protein
MQRSGENIPTIQRRTIRLLRLSGLFSLRGTLSRIDIKRDYFNGKTAEAIRVSIARSLKRLSQRVIIIQCAGKIQLTEQGKERAKDLMQWSTFYSWKRYCQAAGIKI